VVAYQPSAAFKDSPNDRTRGKHSRSDCRLLRQSGSVILWQQAEKAIAAHPLARSARITGNPEATTPKPLNCLQPNASRRSGYPPASPPSTESRSARPPIPVFPLDGSNPLQPPKSSVFLSFSLHAISHRWRTIHLDRFYKLPNSENFGPREALFLKKKVC